LKRTIALWLAACFAAACQIPYLGGAGQAGLPQGGLHRREAERGLLSITPFLSAGVNYATGLGRVTLEPTGRVPEFSTGSVYATGGVSGAHAWRHSVAGIYYTASYNQTLDYGNLSGFGQSLGAAYTREIGRYSELSFVATGAMSNWAFGAPGAAGLSSLNTTGLLYVDPFTPYEMNSEILDARTYSLGFSTNYTRRIGRYWTASAGGVAFDSFRKVKGLPGAFGYVAQGGAGRRLTRRTHLILNYAYLRYELSKAFGDSTAHQGMAGLSWTLDEHSSLSLTGGVARVERLALTRVTLPPALAAILGTDVGQEVFYGDNKFGVAAAHYHRSLRHASITAGYNLSIVPGNGFYVTSRSHSATFQYSRTAFRRWSLGVNASALRYAALMQNLKPQDSYYLTGSASRSVGTLLSFGGSAGYRRILSGNVGFVRSSAYVSAHIALSPHTLRVPAWW